MQSLPLRVFVPQAPILSPLDRKLIHLACQELTCDEIAAQLHYTVKTIQNYLIAIQHTLGVTDRKQLYLRARELGLIDHERTDWLEIINPVDITEALTTKEREVVRYIAQGLHNPEIAQQMGIKEMSVKAHMTKIRVKLGARSRAHAMLKAIAIGLV